MTGGYPSLDFQDCISNIGYARLELVIGEKAVLLQDLWHRNSSTLNFGWLRDLDSFEEDARKPGYSHTRKLQNGRKYYFGLEMVLLVPRFMNIAEKLTWNEFMQTYSHSCIHTRVHRGPHSRIHGCMRAETPGCACMLHAFARKMQT